MDSVKLNRHVSPELGLAVRWEREQVRWEREQCPQPRGVVVATDYFVLPIPFPYDISSAARLVALGICGRFPVHHILRQFASPFPRRLGWGSAAYRKSHPILNAQS